MKKKFSLGKIEKVEKSLNTSKNNIDTQLNTPLTNNSNNKKRTLKISVDLYIKKDESIANLKHITNFNYLKNTKKKRGAFETNDQMPNNTHKRNIITKSTQCLENIVSSSKSSLNIPKFQSNKNIVKIDLNSINSELNILNEKIKSGEKKKVHHLNPKSKNSKVISVPKDEKKQNIKTFSEEKYYENVNNLLRRLQSSKKNQKKNSNKKKNVEPRSNKNTNFQTINTLISLKSIKKEVKEIKDKSSISLNTSIQNLNIPLSPKINITINSNVASPKVPNKSFSSMKKSNNVINTSNNSGLSPKSSILIDNVAIKSIDKSQIFEKYKLTFNEKEELCYVNEVFFLGKLKKRTKSKTLSSEEYKVYHKIDDVDGYYRIIKGDHLLYRYEIIAELGRGAYGQGIKCFDHKINEYVCVKIIRNKEKFNKQALIETKILNYLKENEKQNDYNNVKMIDMFVFRNHICIVFELLDISLYEYLKFQDFKGMNISEIRHIAYQMLKSLSFLKKHSIVHCDLKPENILLKNRHSKKDIKVIDFGSACFEKEKLHTYIQSRFYRAPEVILGLGYSPCVDIWSFGCMIAEIYNGIPIFPGENETDQLFLIMEYLGPPPTDMINRSKRKSLFFDDETKLTSYTNSKGQTMLTSSKKIEKFLDYSNDKLIDLVKKCLTWDPDKRIKPDEALLHPFFVRKKEIDLTIKPNQRQVRSKSFNDRKYKNYTHTNKQIQLSISKVGMNSDLKIV